MHPVSIHIKELSKRYNRNWLFKDIQHEFSAGNNYIITGPNGSGKSTFLLMLAGYITPTRGKVEYSINNSKIEGDEIYSKVAICSPAIDVFDDLTLEESIDLHFKFKHKSGNFSLAEILSISGLEKHREKQVRYFSSGMRQRLKITLSALSETPVLFLDEPAMNLDTNAVQWYYEMLNSYCQNKLIFIGTNNRQLDFPFEAQELNLEQFK